ncbi:hypothetical protein JCM3765_004038 [Sporobolomyces pararoseus]
MRILITLYLLLLLSITTTTQVLGSNTLVDLLSSSPDHSLLLRAFQRTRLIPILNQLNQSTLFAPTDKAIKNALATTEKGERAIQLLLLQDQEQEQELELEEHDNLQLQLRETLLYHCLNFTLFPNPSSNSSTSLKKKLPLNLITLQETLLFPSLSNGYKHEFPHDPPSLPGSPPDDEKRGFPFERPNKGLLKNQGQRLRVIRRTNPNTESSKSRKRIGEQEEEEAEEAEVWIGVDWKGNGGIKTSSSSLQFAKNGVLVPIDSILSKPPNLASIIESTPSLSIFYSLLPCSMIDFLKNTSHLTIFAPTNEAWKGVSELEMRYLKSKFSQLDIQEILQDSSTRNFTTTTTEEEVNGVVGYLQGLFETKKKREEEEEEEEVVLIKTSRNGTLEIENSEQGIKVNQTLIEQGDILASNGVLHTLPSLLLPSGSLALTAEKYLLALNCSKFVELLHSVNLSHLVQIPSKSQDSTTILPNPLPHLTDTTTTFNSQITFASKKEEEEGNLKKGYTILALKDSLISSYSSTPSLSLLTLPSFPSPGSKELKSLLSYHFLSEKFLPKNLKDGTLVETELRSDLLKMNRQKLMVTVQSEEGGEGEGWEKKRRGGRDDDKEVIISFGNANAIAEPVEVGNSIIYLISTILEPPTSLISTAVTDLRLSTFVASVYSTKLDKTFSTTPSITFLIPTNQAFEKLGLVMSYLLLPLPNCKKELENLLRYHAIDQLVYSRDFPSSTGGGGDSDIRFPTLSLDGSEIYLQSVDERNSSSTSTSSMVEVHGPTLGGSPLNGEQKTGKILEIDQLIETGLYHLIDQVELPPTLEINLEKLLKGAKVTTMVELIKQVGMDWVLKGLEEPSIPPPTEEGGQQKVGKDTTKRRAYTILSPTDKALSRLNLTYYLNHPQQLEQLIRLHVIPLDSIPSSSYSSSSSEKKEEKEKEEENEGLPILLSNSITYTTLHSKEFGGKSSKFGKVAFRKWGTDRTSWMVGIKGARGTKGESDSARVLNWGRSTPWIVQTTDNDSDEGLVEGVVQPGGGVILIDSVLLPWEPGWFRSWGWIVLSLLVGVSLIVLVGVWGVRKWRKRSRKNGEGYERVEGEED